MRASFGLSLQSGVNHCLDPSHIVTGFPATAGGDLPKRLGPAAAEALAGAAGLELDDDPVRFSDARVCAPGNQPSIEMARDDRRGPHPKVVRAR